MPVTIDRYTDAPERYDGFGTETISEVGVSRLAMASGNAVRLVRIRQEHDDWQTARYSSGSYAYTTNLAPLPCWVNSGCWEIDRGKLAIADPDAARELERDQ
jgi:hypothetical protein